MGVLKGENSDGAVAGVLEVGLPVSATRECGGETQCVMLMLSSLEVLAAVFETDTANDILRKTRGNREWWLLDGRENGDRDIFRLPKEILSCGSGGRERHRSALQRCHEAIRYNLAKGSILTIHTLF